MPNALPAAVAAFVPLVDEIGRDFINRGGVSFVDGDTIRPPRDPSRKQRNEKLRADIARLGAELVSVLVSSGQPHSLAVELQKFLNALEAEEYSSFRQSWATLKAALQVAAVQVTPTLQTATEGDREQKDMEPPSATHRLHDVARRCNDLIETLSPGFVRDTLAQMPGGHQIPADWAAKAIDSQLYRQLEECWEEARQAARKVGTGDPPPALPAQDVRSHDARNFLVALEQYCHRTAGAGEKKEPTEAPSNGEDDAPHLRSARGGVPGPAVPWPDQLRTFAGETEVIAEQVCLIPGDRRSPSAFGETISERWMVARQLGSKVGALSAPAPVVETADQFRDALYQLAQWAREAANQAAPGPDGRTEKSPADAERVVLLYLAERFRGGSLTVYAARVYDALRAAAFTDADAVNSVGKALNALYLKGAVEPIHRPPDPNPIKRVLLGNEPVQWRLLPKVVELADGLLAPVGAPPATPANGQKTGTPISRTDLPAIVSALRDLYRIVEDPTPTEQNMALYRRYDEQFIPEGRLKPGQTPCAAALVSVGIHLVLQRLMPSGVHSRKECPDITESKLDLDQKAELLSIRNALNVWPLDHTLANDRGAAVQFLRELEKSIQVLEGGRAAPGRATGQHTDTNLSGHLLEGGRSEANAPAPGEGENKPPEEKPIGKTPSGSFTGLLAVARKLRLIGNERTIIEALCERNGRVALADLATLCEWTTPCDDAWNAARGRLNKKLRKHGWRLYTHDREAVAEPLNTGERK